MEYQQKKQAVLSHVEFNNLLSFNLVENKLERNFRTIVEAIMLNEGKINTFGTDIQTVKDQHQRDISELRDKLNYMAGLLNDKKQNPQLNVKSNNSILEEKQRKSQKSISENKVQGQQEKLFQQQNINLEGQGQSVGRQSEKEGLMETLEEVVQKQNIIQGQDALNEIKNDINKLKQQLAAITKKSYRSSRRESITKEISKKILSSQSLHSQKQNLVPSTGEKGIESLRQQLCQEYEQEFNGIHMEVNSLNLSYEQLKDLISQMKRKDTKNNSALNDISAQLKKLQSARIEDNESMQKTLKNLQMELLNVSSQSTPVAAPVKDSIAKQTADKRDGDSQNYKNNINDKFSKLQSMIQGLVSESEFNRFKNEMRSEIENLGNKDNEIAENSVTELRLLNELIKTKSDEIVQNSHDIKNLSEQMRENSSQFERKHNIGLSKIEEVKKSLQNLREDLEFYQSLGAQTQNSENQKQETRIQIVEKKQTESKQVKIAKNGIDGKSAEDLKKYVNLKLHDQRSHLIGQIRDLEKKLSNKNSFQQDIINLWDKISQINLFLGRKADQQDTRKNILYLQKRIQKINNFLMKSQDNTEDARVAKSSWFCLSCDKNLQSYQGKLGKHMVWDSMPIKGGSKPMRDDKKCLPSLKRQ